MRRSALGESGVVVSGLGLGCGAIGNVGVTTTAAGSLVRAALDLGVTTFDTAPSYGDAEEKLGRALEGVRESATIVTKGGYGIEGVADWTPECVAANVDRALARLRTDRIDVFLLHSCPRALLERGDLFEPLLRAKIAGKIRSFGYSGDGDALAWAVTSRVVDVVETSLNVCDQASLASISIARERGIGVIAKRAVANTAWRHFERPAREDEATYWDRLQEMVLSPDDLGDIALRFSAHATGVDCALVGTANVAHLVSAVRTFDRGPLPAAALRMLRSRFDSSWPGVV